MIITDLVYKGSNTNYQSTSDNTSSHMNLIQCNNVEHNGQKVMAEVHFIMELIINININQILIQIFQCHINIANKMHIINNIQNCTPLCI